MEAKASDIIMRWVIVALSTVVFAVVAWGVAVFQSRQDVFESRQADVRERLKALEERYTAHEHSDILRFENRVQREEKK